MEIVLASQSPRRRELLERLGVKNFRIVTPDIDEHMERELPPEELVRRISAEKARAVREQAGMDAVVIAADTVVALDGAVLGKPADELEAFKMLSTLSGCRHQVYTGLTVLRGEERHTVSEETTVAFRELSEEEISCYIQTGEPMDKAGAYGIQGFGALLIEGIQGDYYNVMGLPVCRLGGILRQLGVDCLRLAAGERIDEHMERELPPEELVRRISAEKARAVREQAGMDAVVIAADTVVALDGAVLGKPADELEAFKMLSTLSGCRHQVYTGLTVLRGEERHTVSEETTVAFRELSEEEISCYIQTGEPMDKAGAYGIQGFGALLIEGIQGDYYNVMGLPVCRLGGILRQLGVDCLRLAAGERDSD